MQSTHGTSRTQSRCKIVGAHRDLFSRIDINGDGVISRDELANAVRSGELVICEGPEGGKTPEQVFAALKRQVMNLGCDLDKVPQCTTRNATRRLRTVPW